MAKKKKVVPRCEGYRRTGGMMTLGPVVWRQCPNDAIVMLKIKQVGEKATSMPACMDCWNESKEPRWKIKILSAEPISSTLTTKG